MGKGRPRAVEKGVSRQNFSVGEAAAASSSGCGIIPPAPVYHPSKEEFEDPLEFISKIRPEAELYGICRIVPPEGWNPPFALDLDSFTFPTKTQAIHQLQARPASCDPKTFELEYARFLEKHCGRKVRKRVVFEDGDLDLCRLFNAVKRYGGYDKVVKGKKWGEVFRFVRSKGKLSECAKHVLCRLYREHLYDYEVYYNRLNKEKVKSCKRRSQGEGKSSHILAVSNSNKKRKSNGGRKIDVCEMKEEEREPDQICEQCKSGLHGEVMLLCDRCNKGWHIYCLSPPLKQVPPGNWYCFDCLNSNKDSFGFVPGKSLSLGAFSRVADRAKKRWFGAGSISKMQLEKNFWEIVEGSIGEVEVLYGSDLDTSVYGSGFPRMNDQRPTSVECDAWDKYCASAWNLNNLPKLKGSMLKAVHHNIAGVMVPWLYIGMLFSSFCWHFEDHCFYSMNYLHWGEPKCWYSVPGNAADAFEKVMRKSLPDLFDAQPDLLFQLVTMLNPSVLQANGVPVYNVVQEPGNFIITFPRSFHAGFNFGLNCAEAVNFAPADWIPHGGFSADLYRLYRKPAVLSHEELICVVAESDCESNVSPFLKKELLRIYSNEKTWRERLWKKGLVKSSVMSPRKCPEFVGTEEDPTCIICQQYLYLSAVVCRCRPSSFVCLEHWEHFCECNPSRHCLLYRHTLAELEKLVFAVDKHTSSESRNALPETFSASNPCALARKVKNGHATIAQLVEKWLLHSSSILQNPYSKDAYSSALKEAEQFLWAGSEMDPVRDMVKKLVEARNWAENVRSFLFKIEEGTSFCTCDSDGVDLESVDKLLSFDAAPCNEPAHLKLKDYVEEAKKLIQDVGAMLSSSPQISELEELYSRSCHLRFNSRENEMLAKKLSSAKECMESVRACVNGNCTASIEIDLLYKLKAELHELQVLIPERQRFLELLHKAESYHAECAEILKGPMIFKDVELVIKKMEDFSVNIPELMILRQHYTDAASWISRFLEIRKNIHERVDQDIVIVELNSILKDRGSLKIRVEELPLVELELRKAYCRGKGLKARGNKMTLDFLKQLWAEAVELQIEEENIFVYISEVIKAAVCWEEAAVHIMTTRADMSKFEEMMRASGDIDAVLPSASDIMDAIEAAKCWLKNSMPFLGPALPILPNSSSSLKVETLKELVSHSKLLKISLEEQMKLESVLEQCDNWLQGAASVLQDAKDILDVSNTCDGLDKGLGAKIERLLRSVDGVLTTGLSSGIDFSEVPKLKDIYAMLQWCNRALSLSSVTPSLEEVDRLLEFEREIPAMHVSCTLCSVLIGWLKWVKKALEIIASNGHERCSLSDAEEVFAECQSACISIPLLNCQLEEALQNHRLWQGQVHQFFHLKTSQRSWSQLSQLKDTGENTAFICPELDMVLLEVGKIEKWKQQLKDITGTLLGDTDSHGQAIEKIKNTLNRSLIVYGKLKALRMHDLCMCCFEGLKNSDFITCKTCEDCYHLRCLGHELDNKKLSELYMCSFCRFLESGSVSQTEMDFLRVERKQLELNILAKLLSDMKDLCIQMEERESLEEIVKCVHLCKAHLTAVLDFLSAYQGEDLGAISRKLAVALKATGVASVCDHEDTSKIELAVARHSWRVRVSKLFEGSPKPSILYIQPMLKEGLAIGIPREDHFRCKLTEIKGIALNWTSTAKKVAADGGALSLDKVFQLINEGENLPVCVEREQKLLRSRSMLYCICRKPYDQRPMIACDQCDEWYHFDCIKLVSPPKFFLCPACKPCLVDDCMPKSDCITSTGTALLEPKTPSPEHRLLRVKRDDDQSIRTERASLSGNQDGTFFPSGIDSLWWRNRKPFRRLARKRAELDSLSGFFHLKQCD